MTKKDILYERINHSVGEIIRVPKIVKGDAVQTVDAEIIGIYPFHVLVQDKTKNGEEPKYRWSVMWVDLMGVRG